MVTRADFSRVRKARSVCPVCPGQLALMIFTWDQTLLSLRWRTYLLDLLANGFGHPVNLRRQLHSPLMVNAVTAQAGRWLSGLCEAGSSGFGLTRRDRKDWYLLRPFQCNPVYAWTRDEHLRVRGLQFVKCDGIQECTCLYHLFPQLWVARAIQILAAKFWQGIFWLP